MDLVISTPCDWCASYGLFGDFQCGFYPLPCLNCAGTGYGGIIDEATLTKIKQMREMAYETIKAQTQRLDVAAKLFGIGVTVLTSQDPVEQSQLKREQQRLVDRLNNEFTDDYLDVEKQAIQSAWDFAYHQTPETYRSFVAINRDRIVGRSLRDVQLLDLASQQCRNG